MPARLPNRMLPLVNPCADESGRTTWELPPEVVTWLGIGCSGRYYSALGTVIPQVECEVHEHDGALFLVGKCVHF